MRRWKPLNDSLRLAERRNDRLLQSGILAKLSLLAWDRGQTVASLTIYQRAAMLMQDDPDHWMLAWDGWQLATRLAHAGQIGRAQPLLERWLAYQARVDHPDLEQTRAYVVYLTSQ
jgi:hypothetical protein